MKVLVLSKYGPLAASPRHRFHAYVGPLADRGIHFHFAPLFGDAYVRQLGKPTANRLLLALKAYLGRLRDITRAGRYDLLLIHCELFPYLPSFAEALLDRGGHPFVLDLDDAIFHQYDSHRLAPVRWLLGDKIASVMRRARAVIAGSPYIADYARRHNPRVEVIPTVVDTRRYRVKEGSSDPFTVGWIGSPSTTPHLEHAIPALREAARRAPLRLLTIGAAPRDWPGLDVEMRPWSEDREVDDLLECDVGIMPLPDEPWARGKCAFKLIQYMACGLPTIASPVGANTSVVTPETGLLADTHAEWVASIDRLRANPDLRQKLGAAGRRRADASFSVSVHAERIASLLSRAASPSPRRNLDTTPFENAVPLPLPPTADTKGQVPSHEGRLPLFDRNRPSPGP